MHAFRMGVIAAAARVVASGGVENVLLLLHGDGANGGTVFIDSSLNVHSATLNGTVTTSTTAPKYGSASMQFGGGYLSYPAASNWNIGGTGWRVQFWYRPDDNGTSRDLFFIGAAGTSKGVSLRRYGDGQLGIVYGAGSGLGFTKAGVNVTSGSYHFIDVSHDVGSSTIVVRVDGNVEFTHSGVSSFGSGNLELWVGWGCGISGGNFAADAGTALGAIDEFRITTSASPWSDFSVPTAAFHDPTPPADPLINSVVLLLHMNGANNGTTFTDTSSYARSATVTNAVTDTTSPKFGTASGRATAADGGLQFPSSTDFRTTDEYTLEFWIYCTSFASAYFMATSVGRYFSLSSGGDLVATNWGAGGSMLLSLNTWHHVEVSRASDGTVRTFLDGVLQASGSSSGDASSVPFNVFGVPSRSDLPSFSTGRIDEVRFTRAVRHTANFTPPTAAYPDYVAPS